ncbi:4'-phosphopantetheinyl transferase [Pseudomonas sp. nanlin1]|uniref:4'-phosphopantetheinyl transferase family protein n=1 Tax=Pseudomonas sp. nanlin1 TaxID=3040605 RepID=UPI0038901677
MNIALPRCCSPLQLHWPLPTALPGAVLASLHFDPTQMAPDDFISAGIAPPPSVQRSVPKRQAEFLSGRVCARHALRQLDGLGYTPQIGEDRAPVWSAQHCGSITHGQGWAAAVVAKQIDYRGLGLDAEPLLPVERAERLMGEILTPSELQRLAPSQLAMSVTLTFSLKESLFKALYPIVQKRFYFEHAELLEWDEQGHARLRLLTDLSAEWRSGVELDGQFCLHEGHLLSLVSVAA